MVGDQELRRTPLYEAHLAAGARIVPFAGWLMPERYTGVIEEHNAVRRSVGLFDVSHMGEVTVRGPQALDLLQHLTCNDVATLTDGRAHYNALTTPAGTFVDDLLIYRRGERDYLLITNASNTAKDLAWIEADARRFDAEVRDESLAWALIALQGPHATATLRPLTRADLDALKYYRFVVSDVLGAECIVSRTGYTGEDGFEIYAPASAARPLWDALLAAGEPHGIRPAGLAARDTLRLEARMALYGNDIDDTTTVFEADLGSIVRLGKGPFVGRDVLEREQREGSARKLVGFEMRGRAIARHGYRARHEGRDVGRVTSGTHAPFLEKSIGLAYLPTALTGVGTEFEIDIRGREEGARVVATPFYRRPR